MHSMFVVYSNVNTRALYLSSSRALELKLNSVHHNFSNEILINVVEDFLVLIGDERHCVLIFMITHKLLSLLFSHVAVNKMTDLFQNFYYYYYFL